MKDKLSAPLIALMIIGFLAVIIVTVCYENYSVKKDIRDHETWAVGYYEGIKEYGRNRYASFVFKYRGVTHYTSTRESKIMPLGKAAYTTCFPIRFSSVHPGHAEVLIDEGDNRKVDGLVPRQIRQAVSDGTHMLQFRAWPRPYVFQLKDDYTLRYGFHDSTEYLSLFSPHDDTVKKRLVAASADAPLWEIGYIVADYSDYFVLARAAEMPDSATPQRVQLYAKETGKALLDTGAYWIGADEEQEVLVYGARSVRDTAAQVILYDLHSGKRESYPYPAGLLLTTPVRLVFVAGSMLYLKYELPDHSYTKLEYARGPLPDLPRRSAR